MGSDPGKCQEQVVSELTERRQEAKKKKKKARLQLPTVAIQNLNSLGYFGVQSMRACSSFISAREEKPSNLVWLHTTPQASRGRARLLEEH